MAFNFTYFYRMKKFLLILCCVGSFVPVSATVVLPALISDNMVMQQDEPVHIWGNASPGEKVVVTILKQRIVVQADQRGKWETWLSPMKSKTPVDMTVTGTNSIVVKNILIGEVWIAAGQSNMEWDVSQSNNAAQEIKNATDPSIRLFVVKQTIIDSVQEDVVGSWQVCSSESVKNFSAVGYFFGRGLQQQLKTPIGIIESDWGGTNCQAWTPVAAIEADPRLNYIMTDWKKFSDSFPERRKAYDTALEQWQALSDDQKKNTTLPREPLTLPKEKPGVLYNGMIAPLTFYTIRGVIWYQGEANAYERVAYPYRYLFPTLITAWREKWKQGDFPFLYVQLSTLFKHPYWPVLRESQTETLKFKNTAMAVSVDVGDSTNAHYKNKQIIGHRLELAARAVVYKEDIEFSGPMFRQATIEEDRMRIWFDHAKGLKTIDQAPVRGFIIAGSDGVFFPATAKIENETIVLSNSHVTKPMIVHYAFKDAPVVNLVNGDDLPACPFRTDSKDGL